MDDGNGHKNIFGISAVLELKVKNSTILTFNFNFVCQKLKKSFGFFFIGEYKKGRQILLMICLDNNNLE